MKKSPLNFSDWPSAEKKTIQLLLNEYTEKLSNTESKMLDLIRDF